LPGVVRDALWARAGGGQATELRPISPISLGQMFACVAYQDFMDNTPGDAQRVAACRHHLPGIQAVEYLSRVHLQDNNVPPSFREGIARLSTSVWMSRSWTKDEFLNTLAERGGFGSGFRGVDAAAKGYFNRVVSELTLAQAAMIAALAADRQVDPWCQPETAATMRLRVLESMRDTKAIDEAAFDAASRSELGLTARPADFKPCE
ncbi:MAG TPA: transglycosylase domain-containing protein, partial [Vicinamibacterales bacterium]|nr:transglycosylase domain-containing protein [Vicinamibacterales bacterium]